jgi:hypothetical protein
MFPNEVIDLDGKELLDEFSKETEYKYGNRRIKDWRTPIGMRDVGELPDPDKPRGANLTRDERDWIYFWARRKRIDIEEMQISAHFEQCQNCKLCRCGQAHGRYMFRCCCSRGMKMLGPNVFRELSPGSSKPYEITCL